VDATDVKVPIAVGVQSIFIGEPPDILQIVGMAAIVGFGVWAIVSTLQEAHLRELSFAGSRVKRARASERSGTSSSGL
jgi:hypothetical protein